ncbi:MAG: carbamoyltransferase HypF [Novosphingobium sp.]
MPGLCPDAQDVQRIRLHVSGAVQGVGFRPFVYRLAVAEGLAGFVRNTGAGVMLEVEGSGPDVERFLARLRREIAPPAVIDRLTCEPLEPVRSPGVAVLPSHIGDRPSSHVLPDLAPCGECRAELFDSTNRRYRYPFITCMHCGPRYSIIEAVPYDRPRTAMQHFVMCPACQTEYDDPASRRFHAEANACPECGPALALHGVDGTLLAMRSDALAQAIVALREGHIVALKGLGGFQLLADARNEAAIEQLRQRKNRPAKPFAVMVRSAAEAAEIAHVSPLERGALESPVAPILLLQARGDTVVPLAANVAPGNPDIGLMLPATSLHDLLMDSLGFPVIATSGNRGGEPIAADDDEAFARLSGIADLFLTHDRPIVHPVDDPVMRVIAGNVTTLRCGRGLAPLVLPEPRQSQSVLALGGHMKDALALGREERIVLGPHIGDLDHIETRKAFARSVESLCGLYGLEPAVVACDAHPDYYSSQAVEAMRAAVCKVPHHLAHVLSVIVENGLDGPVLGIAWDGTGYGNDGTIWGGEFLAVEGFCSRRVAHLMPFPLPGGEAAVREPRRAALGALHTVYGKPLWDMRDLPCMTAFAAEECAMLRTMLERSLNAPRTSSAGRLFDAAAAIMGLCQTATFDGEAAMAVEHAARSAREVQGLPSPVLVAADDAPQIDWRPMLKALVEGVKAGVPVGDLAAGFHDWLVEAMLEIARRVGIAQVVLGGGCFQNALLTGRSSERLQEAGFRVYRNIRVPPNDGGLAVGQAAYAARWLDEVTG